MDTLRADAVTPPLHVDRLEALADDIGRLQRRVEPETSLAHLSERIARHVEALLQLGEPSAAEIARWYAPGDEEAIDEALRLVDERERRLRARLRLPEPCIGQSWWVLRGPKDLTGEEKLHWDIWRSFPRDSIAQHEQRVRAQLRKKAA